MWWGCAKTSTVTLCEACSSCLGRGCGRGICGVPVTLPIAYPGQSNALSDSKYVFYNSVQTSCRAGTIKVRVAHRVSQDVSRIKPGCGTGGFVTCFLGFAGACVPLSQFRCYIRRTYKRPSVMKLTISAEPSYVRRSCLRMLERTRKGCKAGVAMRLKLRDMGSRALLGVKQYRAITRFVSTTLRVNECRFSLYTRVVTSLP